MATENASIAPGRADPGPAILRRGLESFLRHHHCHVKKPPGTPVSGAFCAPRRRGHPSPGGMALLSRWWPGAGYAGVGRQSR